MKNNKVVIIIFLVLAVAAAWIWFSKSSTTLKGELRDFAYADTSAISKIFMADKEGRKALLTRTGSGSWMVNGKYPARQDAINTLLFTVRSLEVRSPVGKNLYNNTMKLMAAQSVKVEIYAHDELVKTYYVGHPTMDNLGTFMYMEGSTVPFIMHIPGFNGFLSTRYFASEAEWRDKAFIRLLPQRITEVSLTDNFKPGRSFSIVRQLDSSYTVFGGTPLMPFKPVDEGRVRQYLAGLRMVAFERLDHELPKFRRDSLVKAGPFAVFSIKTDDGKNRELRCYRKPVGTGPGMLIDNFGKALPFDYDRFYGLFGQDTSLMVCQYFHFDKVFKDPRGFVIGQVVKPSMNRFE